MKKVSLFGFFISGMLLIGFPNSILFAQSPASQAVVSKPIFKDGKFIFYNPLFFKDSSKNLKTGVFKPPMPPCYHCASTLSSPRIAIEDDPIILYITSQNATCGYGSGSIIVQVANGTPPYTYSMDGESSQLTGNFPVVGAGTHTILVTDATGTTATANVTLTNILPGPVVVPYFITAYPSTCSASDGVIELEPNGGTPPYTYSMDLVNFQTSNIFSNLASGNYFFYVEDANGCIGVVNVFPFLSRFCNYSLIPDAGGYVCGDQKNISVIETGIDNGPYNGPFLYSLDSINYQSTGNFNNIGPGVYKVYIKDNAGKVRIYGFDEAEDCLISIQYIEVSAACMQNDGSLSVTASNGTPPYTYSIDGINYQTNNTFNGLAPGNYYITAKDASGVKSSLQASVYDRCPVVEGVASAATCGGDDGVITVAGFKGTAPYQFSIDGTNFQSGNSFPGLAPGNYTITIKDALGFTGTVQLTVNNGCLAASAVANASTCGNSNGSIMVSVMNGTPPYQYSSDGTNFQTSDTLNGLAAGGYTVTVKDANGVTATANRTVTNISGPQINATPSPASCANNDGGLNVSNIGGTPPFQYSLDGVNFQGIGAFSGLDTGMKTVMVKDANGCIGSTQAIVPVLSNLTVDAGNDITICEGTSTSLNGSSNGDSFSWTPALSLDNATSLMPLASPGSSTKYYLMATLGICSKIDSVTVFVNPAPIPDAGVDTSTCYGKNIQLQGSGGADYTWSPDTYLDNAGMSDPTLVNPISTVTYSLTVTDINNCKALKPATITVTVKPLAKVFAGNDTSVIINQPLQLNAIDVNNSGFDQFLWSPSLGLSSATIPDPVASITRNITYYVTASTPEGCEGVDSISINVFAISDIFAPNAFTPNGDGHNDILKAIPIGIREFKYFAVYGRWGNRVFYTTNQEQGWDGTIRGNPQAAGTYIWMAAGIDYRGNYVERKGSVILIR